MIPVIAAMMTAMMEVTMAMPPRVRFIHTLREEYMSLAIPDRSRSAAMKMKSGIEIRT